MPATTPDQIETLEAKLKTAIGGLGDAPDAAAKRELEKKLRRAQRRRRRMAVEAARQAKARPAAEAAS
jgi:hypothetical protein